MTTKEIYDLASKLTDKQVENIVNGWVKDGEKKCIESYESLVRLGDSPSLACASTIADKIRETNNYRAYANAYHY